MFTTLIFLKQLFRETYLTKKKTLLIFSNITNMSTLEAKRRRTGIAATALSRPFRSPFKAANSADGDPQTQRAGFVTPEHNCSPSRYHVLSSAGAKATPIFPDSQDPDLHLSLKSAVTSNTQFEIGPILKAQRQLENRLRKLIEELDVAEQARKIENDSLKNKYRGEEVDGELRDLAQRWKTASRQAAEELFGGVKDRINRYVDGDGSCYLILTYQTSSMTIPTN